LFNTSALGYQPLPPNRNRPEKATGYRGKPWSIAIMLPESCLKVPTLLLYPAEPSPAVDPLESLLTIQEAAAYMQVTADWLNILRKREIGPQYIRTSRRFIRYRRSDIEAWLLLHTRPSA